MRTMSNRRFRPSEHLARLAAVAGDVTVDARALQQLEGDLLVDLIVLHKEHPCALGRARASLLSFGAFLMAGTTSGAKACNMASTSVDGVTGFTRKSAAPACSARALSPSPPPDALRTNTTGGFFKAPLAAIRRVASIPSIPGIFQSIRTRPNGSSASAACTADHAFFSRPRRFDAKAQR